MEKSMEKKKRRLKNINPADLHTSISHLLMSHRSKNFGRTQLNTNVYIDKFLICTIVYFLLLVLDSL